MADYADKTNQKTGLCKWSLTFLKQSVTPEALLDTFQDTTVQDIIVSNKHREAWARAWCHFLKLSIVHESAELSQQRWNYVSPERWKQHQNDFLRYQKRQQALEKMRATTRKNKQL